MFDDFEIIIPVIGSPKYHRAFNALTAAGFSPRVSLSQDLPPEIPHTLPAMRGFWLEESPKRFVVFMDCDMRFFVRKSSEFDTFRKATPDDFAFLFQELFCRHTDGKMRIGIPTIEEAWGHWPWHCDDLAVDSFLSIDTELFDFSYSYEVKRGYCDWILKDWAYAKGGFTWLV